MPRFRGRPDRFPPRLPEPLSPGSPEDIPQFAMARDGSVIAWTPPEGIEELDAFRVLHFIQRDTDLRLELTARPCSAEGTKTAREVAEDDILHAYNRAHKTAEAFEALPKYGYVVEVREESLRRENDGNILLFDYCAWMRATLLPEKSGFAEDKGAGIIVDTSPETATYWRVVLRRGSASDHSEMHELGSRASLETLRRVEVTPGPAASSDEAAFWFRGAGFRLSSPWVISPRHAIVRAEPYPVFDGHSDDVLENDLSFELFALQRISDVDLDREVAVEVDHHLIPGRTKVVSENTVPAHGHEFLRSVDIFVQPEYRTVDPADGGDVEGNRNMEGAEPTARMVKHAQHNRVAWVRVGSGHVICVRSEFRSKQIPHLERWWKEALARLFTWAPEG